MTGKPHNRRKYDVNLCIISINMASKETYYSKINESFHPLICTGLYISRIKSGKYEAGGHGSMARELVTDITKHEHKQQIPLAPQSSIVSLQLPFKLGPLLLRCSYQY